MVALARVNLDGLVLPVAEASAMNTRTPVGTQDFTMACTRTGGDMNKTAAARAGAIPAMITAMQRFKKDPEVQEEAIACLTSLCDTLGRASVAARLGLIDAVIAAIKSRNYGEIEGKLTESSCIIMCMFSDDQKLRQDMVNAGALMVAKQAPQ
eukprot:Skav208933  [mRNA]  locus=scaffold875:15922:22984:+ [translate_table: standard]